MENKKPDIISNKVLERGTVSFGKIDLNHTGRAVNEVELNLELQQDEKRRPVISVRCGVWNSAKTDYQMCGQCLEAISPKVRENRKLWVEVRDIWRKWHLNDCKAGTPEQYDLLAERFRHLGGRTKWEDEVAYLKSIGKYEVEREGKTVRWGERYIYWEIPGEILERFQEIIRTGK